jgi:hypothetical protein
MESVATDKQIIESLSVVERPLLGRKAVVRIFSLHRRVVVRRGDMTMKKSLGGGGA